MSCEQPETSFLLWSLKYQLIHDFIVLQANPHLFFYTYWVFIKLQKGNTNNYSSKNAWKHNKALVLQDL